LPAPSSRCDRRPGGQELPGVWKTAASRPASRSPEQFEVYFEVLLGFLGRRDQKKTKGLFSRVGQYIFFSFGNVSCTCKKNRLALLRAMTHAKDNHDRKKARSLLFLPI
jgi:hypothetical protein